jgi:dTDP-4-amino-4,6-dideoxygalactose transaminase
VAGNLPESAQLTAVPFVDLRPMNEQVRERVLADQAALVDTGAFVNGSAVSEFEESFAAYTGRQGCVGVANGLDALRLALLGLGLRPGDEVIVPAMTFIATYEAVEQAGGVPVPVEVLEDDCGMDPAAAEAAVTERTRAIMPVHLYGQLSDMMALAALAQRRGLTVVEDACQAHGAARDGIGAGASGTAAAFSFYPAKNLGAWGDAGALVADDEELMRIVRALREHGQTRKYHSEWSGYTSRLDAFQAVVLSEKLRFLDDWNEQRRDAARAYGEALEGVGDLVLPTEVPGSRHVWHLYAVRTQDPHGLATHLAERAVGTARHYPVAPFLAPPYASLGFGEGSFPVAEAIARETLSLPMFPGISEEQVAAVVDGVTSFFDG